MNGSRTQRDRSTPLYIADNGTAVRFVCMQSTRRAVPVGTIPAYVSRTALPQGDIFTVAGTGTSGSSGDGKAANTATIEACTGSQPTAPTTSSSARPRPRLLLLLLLLLRSSALAFSCRRPQIGGRYESRAGVRDLLPLRPPNASRSESTRRRPRHGSATSQAPGRPRAGWLRRDQPRRRRPFSC